MASLVCRRCSSIFPTRRNIFRDIQGLSTFRRSLVLLSKQNDNFNFVTCGNDVSRNHLRTPLDSSLGLVFARRYCAEKGDRKQEQESSENDSAKDEDKVLTVPNALSAFRILMAPYVGYLIVQDSLSMAMGLFLVCGATDSIDGYIARRFPGQQSVLGSVLDPLGDKLMVGIISLCLTYTGLFPWQLLSAILLKDVGLVVASLAVRYHTLEKPKTLQRFFDVTNATVQFKPNTIGKRAMFLQILAITSSLAAPVLSLANHPALVGLWWVTGAATVASGLSYIPGSGFKKLTKRRS
eukprot:scpid88695/ scgid4269/ Probable cardiolipin synthase